VTEEPARPERMSAAPAGAGADRQDAAPGLVGFVWAHSRREQIWLLLLTALSFPVVYLSLEVPKIIVNDAISGTDFPRSVAGVEIGQIPYLLLLCLLFLGLVVVINGFKWVINIGIGMAGERLLRRMRFELADQVARFPMRRLRGVRQGETIQAVMGEIEPLGGFFGEVLVTPAFQGGLLAVYMAFIFMQDPWLGLAAIAFYPVQSVLVPVLQARIVRLNRARAANARGVADRIGELISLAPEIRGHGTLGWHLAQLSAGLHSNTLIRQAIFRRKYTIKFLNNFIAQLTPFFFYAIGGALVIAGRLDFGALVAVIAAYKDLAGPWKAVLGYVQRLSDFTARYRFVRESVAVEGGIDPRRAAPGPAAPLEGDLSVRRVAVDPETDLPAIPALDLTAGEVMAVSKARAGRPGVRCWPAAG